MGFFRGEDEFDKHLQNCLVSFCMSNANEMNAGISKSILIRKMEISLKFAYEKRFIFVIRHNKENLIQSNGGKLL